MRAALAVIIASFLLFSGHAGRTQAPPIDFNPSEPLVLDLTKPLPFGCLGWSEQTRVALCVTGGREHGSRSSWSLMFAGPGARALRPIEIMSMESNRPPLVLEAADVDALKPILAKGQFLKLASPRALLSQGDHLELGTPSVGLRWSDRGTGKLAVGDEHSPDREERASLVELRCGRGRWQKVFRWISFAGIYGPNDGPVKIMVHALKGGANGVLLFEQYRNWGAEGDGGDVISAAAMELGPACRW